MFYEQLVDVCRFGIIFIKIPKPRDDCIHLRVNCNENLSRIVFFPSEWIFYYTHRTNELFNVACKMRRAIFAILSHREESNKRRFLFVNFEAGALVHLAKIDGNRAWDFPCWNFRWIPELENGKHREMVMRQFFWYWGRIFDDRKHLQSVYRDLESPITLSSHHNRYLFLKDWPLLDTTLFHVPGSSSRKNYPSLSTIHESNYFSNYQKIYFRNMWINTW